MMDRTIDRENSHELESLSELDDWELADGEEDIRGRRLVATDGESLGTIEELLVDRDRERVAAVRLDNGRTIPADPLMIRDDAVLIDENRVQTEREGEPHRAFLIVRSRRAV